MKRLWSFMLAALLAVSLCGCGGNTSTVSDEGGETTTSTNTTVPTTTEKPTTTTTTSTPFPDMSTREEHPTTAPNRAPNAAGVVNIVDWTEILSIGVGDAFQTFYEDGDYEYQFNTWKKEYVLVHYADGGEKTVDAALADGDITLKDLDSYGIAYRKRPKETTTTTTKESTTTTTEKPTTTTTTTEPTTTTTTNPTNPPRTPNANGVINIVDWEDVYGVDEHLAVIDVFYSDEIYEYYFGHPKAVTVFFADGSSKSIEEALEKGEITVQDLEEFGIGFGKAPKKLMFYELENDVKGEPELFYSDEMYDYYFERPISDYVVAHEGYSRILFKEALERGVKASIDDFISIEHDIPYFVVRKEDATTPPTVLDTITTTKREDPGFQLGKVEFYLTEKATKEFPVVDGTAEKILSERLGIDISSISEAGKSKIDGKGTGERWRFEIWLEEKDKESTLEAVAKLKKHKDIYSASTIAATMYVGEIYVTLTAEATWQYTAADYKPKALSEKFEIPVTGVIETFLQEEYSAKDGKPTGRYRQVLLITTDYGTEHSTEAIAKKIKRHKDVFDAKPNWVE